MRTWFNLNKAGIMASWKRILLRSAGFGFGVAVVLVLVFGVYSWWSGRPPSWSSNKVTAKSTQLTFLTQGEDLHFRFRYALTNNSNEDYQVASPDSGALMKKISEDGSLEKLEGATWDSAVLIPPKQSINVVFDVPFHLSNFGTTAAELNGSNPASENPTPQYVQFVNRRLKEMNGLVLMDYSHRYKVDLPSGWTDLKQ